MKSLANPIRLFSEIVLAIAASEAVVMLVLPQVAPGLDGFGLAMLDVMLLGLLSGPLVYWRCVAAFQQPLTLGIRKESKALGLGAAFAMTALAQVLGLIITASGVVWQKSAIDTGARTRFDNGAERIKIEVQRRMNLPLYGLRGARGTYASNGKFTRDGFREYVESRDTDSEFAGIRGFGFVERVMRDDLSAFIAREKADGVPNFEVHTSGDASDLYVVKYIEPLSANASAWGYDMGQDPTRREVAERAVLSGQPALSGRISLRQDSKHGPGFLYMLPVYRRGTDPVTPAQHRAALVGLLYAPMVIDEMMEGVAQAAEGMLDFELFDSETLSDQSLIFDGDHHLDSVVGPVTDKDFTGRLLKSTSTFMVGGRAITLRVSSTPAFEASIDRSNLMFVGVGGSLVSFLGALAVWLLAVGRLRAQRRAQHMTGDLDRLARVAQHTTNAVTIADTQMRITWVNEGFTQISGYTLVEVIGRTPGELFGSGNSNPEMIETLQRSIRDGSACRVELINRAKDGREYWIDTEIQPTRNAAGVLTGFIEIGTDITALKHTQQRLETAMRESDTLLTTLHVHAIVSVADREGKLIDVNDAFCEISKYSRDELIGQDHSIVNSGLHTVEFWTDMWSTISKGLSWRGDICNRAKDGSLYWVDSMIAAFIGDDGEVEKFVSIRTDITASKADQMRMAELTDRLSLAIEGSSDGLWDWMDINADAQWWSPSYYALMGYTPQEIPATVAGFHSILHPDHVEMCHKTSQDALAGIREYDEEHLLRTKDRGYRWFRSRAKVYRDAQGRPIRMAGASQDIHDRKMAEQQLRDAMLHAQEASVAKSQFLANMSHEIRTPMNAILGMLKLLQNTELNARQLDYAAKTEGAARSLLGLLNDILDFSKVEAGKMTLDPRPFRVDRLMRDLSVILAANVGSKDIEVLFDLDPDIPKSLVGDDMRLQQVLINLGGNAIKFTNRGEVVLRVQVAQQLPDGVVLNFAVQDSGIGIAPENQARIFNGFSQAEASTTRRFGGTGLGLAISSRLVTLLGGELQLQSTLGVGSTFHFQARFAHSELPEPPRAMVAPVLSSAMRVLLVDDNALARELMAPMLRSLGWSVDVATCGTQAIDMVQNALDAERPYGIIFMDWQMPDMDGWQATERIRQLTDGQESSPLILMVTAHGRETLSQRGTQELAMLNGFLVKPITASMLFDAVADATAANATAAMGLNPAAPQLPEKALRLRGLRLLVVEDNKINQMVAKGLLSQEGADVELADNGQLGVDALLAGNAAFDAVLMDVQMPVMDGYEATRAIRTRLGLTELPIIAMTANAMASDRTACLNAGMNDHVGKPFELDNLVSLLLHYCRSGSRVPMEPVALPVHDGQATSYPLGDFDDAGALQRMGGDAAMLGKVLQTFARDVAIVPVQLSEHLEAGAVDEAARTLHTLKGLAATVGARHLAQVAIALERQMKAGVHADQYPELIRTLDVAVRATAQTLAPIVEKHAVASRPQTAATGAAADAALLKDLQTLCGLLEQSDMEALELHARIRQTCGATMAEAMEPLDAAMADLDFDEAAVQCRNLLTQLDKSA